MSETFKKIKHNVFLETLVKSLIAGFSFGLLLVGTLWLTLKLTGNTWNPFLYVAIGLAAAVIAGGTLFAFLFPSDRRLAKRLDDTFRFQEKIQTMVAFKDVDEEMVRLQRTDAEKRLRELPKGSLKVKNIWQYAVAFCLAVATFITAAILPGNTIEGGADDSFAISNRQITELRSLIIYVENSDMETTPKQAVVEELETLLAELYKTDSKAEMKEKVKAVMLFTDSVVEECNTAKEIGIAMNAQVQAQTQKIAPSIAAMDSSAFSAVLEEIKADFTELSVVTAMSNALSIALINSGVKTTDSLHVAVTSLKANLEKITETELETQLESAFTAAKGQIGSVLVQQKVNDETRDYVIRRLMEIFGLQLSELPTLSADVNIEAGNSGSGVPDDKEDDKVNTGGAGGDEVLVGGSGMIFEPTLNDGAGGYIEYIDALQDIYYKRYLQMCEEGSISEEARIYLDKYFDILYGLKDQ